MFTGFLEASSATLYSPSRARTCNNSVNSRVLYHWAIRDYSVKLTKIILSQCLTDCKNYFIKSAPLCIWDADSASLLYLHELRYCTGVISNIFLNWRLKCINSLKFSFCLSLLTKSKKLITTDQPYFHLFLFQFKIQSVIVIRNSFSFRCWRNNLLEIFLFN